MDQNDRAIQLIGGAVVLVLLYWILKTCCPSLLERSAPYDIPDDVTVQSPCTCTGPISGVVTHVQDGDGFRFYHSCPGSQSNDTLRIRLAGIDAPEMGKDGRPGQPYAQEAKDYLRRLVHRKSLNLVKLTTDQYGRILAIAYLPESNLNVNLEMVRKGLACVYQGRDQAYGGIGQQLWNLQAQAISARTGMWSIPNVQTPMEWKRHQRAQNPIRVV